MNGDSGKVLDSPIKILEMERNWKGKLSECETRERIGKLSNYFREERKGLLSKIIGQMTMYGCIDIEIDKGVF